jgi:hypothetical protein
MRERFIDSQRETRRWWATGKKGLLVRDRHAERKKRANSRRMTRSNAQVPSAAKAATPQPKQFNHGFHGFHGSEESISHP